MRAGQDEPIEKPPRLLPTIDLLTFEIAEANGSSGCWRPPTTSGPRRPGLPGLQRTRVASMSRTRGGLAVVCLLG